MTDVGEILIEGRRRRGWSQQELASRAGVSLSTISRTEQKKGLPNTNSLRRIAVAIGYDADALVRQMRDPGKSAPAASAAWINDSAAVNSTSQPRPLFPSTNLIANRPPVPAALHAPPTMTRVPRFGGVSAVGADERFEQPEQYSDVPDIGIDFTVVVDGQCMEPRYEDGETVGCSIRRWQREGFVWDCDYWIRFKNGETTLKRVRQDPKRRDRLLLVPVNQEARQFTKLKSEVERAARVIAVLTV